MYARSVSVSVTVLFGGALGRRSVRQGACVEGSWSCFRIVCGAVGVGAVEWGVVGCEGGSFYTLRHACAHTLMCAVLAAAGCRVVVH